MKSQRKVVYPSEEKESAWYDFEGFSIRDCGPVDDKIKSWEDALNRPSIHTYHLDEWFNNLTNTQLQDGIDWLEEKIMDPAEPYSERLASLWYIAISVRDRRDNEAEKEEIEDSEVIMEEVD